jgi:hypothetical protein
MMLSSNLHHMPLVLSLTCVFILKAIYLSLQNWLVAGFSLQSTAWPKGQIHPDNYLRPVEMHVPSVLEALKKKDGGF